LKSVVLVIKAVKVERKTKPENPGNGAKKRTFFNKNTMMFSAIWK